MEIHNNISLELESDELVALARLDIEKGNVEQALRKLKAVISGNAPEAEALAMSARIYAQLGLRSKAQVLFEKFLSLQPDALNEKFQLGMVHFESGDPARAGRLWEEVLNVYPTHPPALHYMGLLGIQQNRLPEARRHLEVLLKAVPTDNFYYEPSKELLRSLDHSTNADQTTNRTSQSGFPYQNEH